MPRELLEPLPVSRGAQAAAQASRRRRILPVRQSHNRPVVESRQTTTAENQQLAENQQMTPA